MYHEIIIQSYDCFYIVGLGVHLFSMKILCQVIKSVFIR
jgi:hypothetical protein